MIAERYLIIIRISKKDGHTEYFDGHGDWSRKIGSDTGDGHAMAGVAMYDLDDPDPQRVLEAWAEECKLFRYEIRVLRFALEIAR